MPRSNENPNKIQPKVTRRSKKAGADKPAATNPPEQKLGDTPVAPWEMPTPDEKEQGKPVRRALKEAVKEVGWQEKADEVIGNLESATAGQTVTQIEKEQPKTAAPTEAARTAPEGQKTERVLEETARAVATPNARQRDVVSEAAQEVLNPEQQGTPATITSPQERQYLRRAVLKRLKPLDALDADLFLMVNHLPHTRFLNFVFYSLIMAFKGGAAWYLLLGLIGLRNRETGRTLFHEVALPMAVAGTLVELPVKSYFRRRRPFISITQAIVIGKTPGGWSFPSGHSAVAFAGAWLLNRKYPRMYLGDHYRGDVASGSILGVLFAMGINWIVRRRKKR